MRQLQIADKIISDASNAFVIAEIGNNHQGSLDKCKALFKAAADAGCDAVKLQKRDNRNLYHKSLYESEYNSEHAFGPTYGKHREMLELGWDEYKELQDYAEGLGLIFFATAFDIVSADFLRSLDIPVYKIASGDLTNIPLIRHVASFGKPVILSTGGGNVEDVIRAIEAIEYTSDGEFMSGRQFAILQCTAAYPVEPHEMNLRVIETYKTLCPNVIIGLSDHYDGIALAPVAYTLGARIFEKHFTLSHTWKGSDQAFSLEPEGMRRMVRDLRATKEALGDGYKRPYESEAPGIQKMAKSLVASGDLDAGHVLSLSDFKMQSPAGGLSPYKIDKLVGRKLRTPLVDGEIITSSGIVL